MHSRPPAQHMPIPISQDEYDLAIQRRLETEIRTLDNDIEMLTKMDITPNGINNLDIQLRFMYERLSNIQYLDSVLKSYKS